MNWRLPLILGLSLQCGPPGALAAAPAGAVDYARDVRPILADACFTCHGPDAPARKAGLRLDRRDAATATLASGAAAVVPGKPDESELVRRVASDDPDDVMPPPRSLHQLTAGQKLTLRRWIEQGAAYAEHWSYGPVRRPAPPDVVRNDWVRNDVDRFVLAKLEASGLSPAAEAPPAMLLRRMSFDLTGLPPAPDEVSRAADLVGPGSDYAERKLRSDAHGEHLARKWMDVARYADSAGYEVDALFWHAWRYRDFLIRAFRDNKPLDRFIEDQIAGDQFRPDSADARDGTLFLTIGPKREESGIARPAEREYEWLTDVADTTGAAFLGVTVGCARCHDHKFDPISQADYFGLQSLFADAILEARRPDKGYDGFGKKGEQSFFVVPRPKPVTLKLLKRGELELPGGDAPVALPASFPGGGPLAADAPPGRRRAALAAWLTRPDNPLVARVLANRIWQWHFGAGLVRTPDDFGLKGEPPTHPELLDWLASELVSSGWNLRHLHRLIIGSAAYRMSSIGTARSLAADPQNRLLSRFPRRRLSAEELRDATLAVSGELNPKPFGPPVVPPVEDFELAGIRNANWQVTADPAEHARRSVYLAVRRSVTTAFAAAFDAPDSVSSCAARMTTVVPAQSLAMWNSRDSLGRARALADRLCGSPGRPRRASGASPPSSSPRGRSPCAAPRASPPPLSPPRPGHRRLGRRGRTSRRPSRRPARPGSSGAWHFSTATSSSMSINPHSPPIFSRRQALARAGAGFGSLALAHLLHEQNLLASDAAASPAAPTPRPARAHPPAPHPLAPRPPHHAPKARAIIHLFMHGGPSQVDTFDPKPALDRSDGQPPPAEYHNLQLQFTDVRKQKLMRSRMTFRKCGQSGIDICDALPRLQGVADELCVIRSMHHEVFNHAPGIWLHNTGSSVAGRPSLGSWLAYGLGSEARDLPAFVVMNAQPIKPGPGVWGSGFLSAIYQGTTVRPTGGTPIPHLAPQPAMQSADRQAMLRYAQTLNRAHADARGAGGAPDAELDARIASHELAFAMQAAAPEAVDLKRESPATRELYGRGFGEQCLTARRLVERGVRYVQIYHGGGTTDWDTHGDNHAGQAARLREVDQGCAALIADLKARGMLDDTLVVWTGEFGRTPTTEGKNGRDHNPYGYSMWLAGAGVKGGQAYGATDDLGFRVVDQPVHLHDLNATLLHLMGLDHERLTYRFSGRDFRLTDVHGRVLHEILA
jgi:uncharacterized protein (DUF1501 family)